LESGVKVPDLPETIGEGIRKTNVVMEVPTSTANTEEEEALADPVVLETEETYLQAFDLDSSHGDAAMREAGDDWLQTDTEKQKNLDKAEYVEQKARKYVKMKKSSYVRQRISEALKSQRAHNATTTRRRRPGERIDRWLGRHRRRRRRRRRSVRLDPASRSYAG
jgi:hypothetical protein